LAQPHSFQGTALQPFRVVRRIELAQQVLAEHRLRDIIRENVFDFDPLRIGSILADAASPALEKAQNGFMT
jgi:hypothetical protein